MTGYDGGIVSELRGLSAWFAAHSPQSRGEIIGRDPLGMVLYGDIRSFSGCEKRRILSRVAEETEKNPWITRAVGLDPNLQYLATPDMREYFQGVLADQQGDDTHQSFVGFLLKTLQHESRIPELAGVLMEIVRDNGQRPEIRKYALRAFIRQREKTAETAAELEALLEDVHSGSVRDPDDELLGLLLLELYPDSLSASDIWKHFRTPKNPNFYGMYYFFWINLVEQSTTAELDALIGEFLKCLEQVLEEYKSGGRQFGLFSELRLRMLPRLLETTEKEVLSDDLFSWLWVASAPEVWGPGSGEEKRAICEWLNNYPEAKKSVFSAGAKRNIAPRDIFFRLFWDLGVVPPSDFGLFCLEEAVGATDEESRDFFLHETVKAIKSSNFSEGLSEGTVKEKLADHPVLERRFMDLVTEYDSRREESLSHERDLQKKVLKHREAQRKQQQAWIDKVRSNEEALRENRCPIYLIHELAGVYFGLVTDVAGGTPLDRLRNFLGGDENLVRAVQESFKGSISRAEVPNEAEIIKLGKESRLHFLALPFLAGLTEIFRNGSESGREPLTEKQMHQALAFYFSAPIATSVLESQSSWYRSLIKRNPEMVSDVLIKSVRSMLHKGRSTKTSIEPLLLQEDHAAVARLATLPILKAFPVRCGAWRMEELNYLLRAALLHCDEEQFLSLIKKKLSFSSMNVAQRVYWLTAGYIVSPSGFFEELETYLMGRESRIQNLVDFLALTHSIRPDTKRVERLDVPATKLLIQLIGPLYKPHWLSSGEVVSSFDKSWQAAELVYDLIRKLGSFQSPCATEALEELSSDDALRSWSSYILSVSYEQKSIRRECDFRQPDVEQVLETLGNKKPATVADLAALTTDVLNELARDIRDGNTSDWRRYWDMDKNNKPFKPRAENLCRDALLSDMKRKFESSGIDVQLEGHYADDKRSDIRVAYRGEYNVPVEIKKSYHRDLWSAIEDQLIAKYTRDPGADGHGIYLVFWFGRKFCQSPAGENRPRNAEELQEQLLNSLSAYHRRKISICVIDVAKPSC